MSNGLILPPGALPTPDPNLRQEVAAVVKANIRQLLTDVLADKLGHAMAVAAGRVFWRETFVRNMGAFWGNSRGEADHMADVTFDCITRAWRDGYPGESAFQFLDKVHVPSPQSAAEFEKEVEESWELEIGGSEEALNRHYHGSARVRKGRDIFSSFWQKDPSQKPN